MQRGCAMLMALVCGASAAHAQTTLKVDQIRSFAGVPGTRSLQFQRADTIAPSNGGALLGVEVELNLTVSGGSLWVDNDGMQGGTVDVFYIVSAFSTSDDIALESLRARAVNQDSFFLGPDDEHPGGAPVFSAEGGADEGMLAPFNSFYAWDDGFIGESPLLDMFRGSDPFEIDVTVETSFGIFGMPSVAGSFSGINVEDVTFRMSYIYAPAPGTLAFFGVALLRRRRR